MPISGLIYYLIIFYFSEVYFDVRVNDVESGDTHEDLFIAKELLMPSRGEKVSFL